VKEYNGNNSGKGATHHDHHNKIEVTDYKDDKNEE